MSELVGEFPVKSTYSELKSLPPELDSDVISQSGLTGILGVAAGPSVGRAQFEFLLLIPIAASVAVSEAVVLVSAWAAPEIAGKAGHPVPSVMTVGENYRAFR